MSKNPKPYLVFVYGTLQSGQGNNPVMTEGGSATLLGKATTLQKFYMASGGFPRVAKYPLDPPSLGINRNDFRGQVRGELWNIDDGALAACDRLESHPRFYCREKVTVTLDGDRSRHQAWIYLIVDLPAIEHCIAKGKDGVLEWKPFKYSMEAANE